MTTSRQAILDRFHRADRREPMYVPDLTLWYSWHRRQGTLPGSCRRCSLAQIARTMGVPAWVTVRPWRIETQDVEIETVEDDRERVTRSVTSAGTLTARWSVGPDRDWWQTEYPAKTVEDLSTALQLVRARSYVIDAGELAELRTEIGEDGILALELPQQPYSDLLHSYLGWGEGLMLLADGEDLVAEILETLASKLRHLVEQVAHLPADIVLAPDNLDGQFISPPAFQRYMADGYRHTVKVLHERAKSLVVQVGGPMVRHSQMLRSAKRVRPLARRSPCGAVSLRTGCSRRTTGPPSRRRSTRPPARRSEMVV
jgi:hypothetical protein